MFAMAAHTGARRSELIRARVEDIDLADRVATVREKKKTRGVYTSRRVPVSKLLTAALKPLMNDDRVYLFGDGQDALSADIAHQTFERSVKGKFSGVKGWHVLRHSFISALASSGTDQRIIDEFAGHSTEEQRRRYRHLTPEKTQRAIQLVFG